MGNGTVIIGAGHAPVSWRSAIALVAIDSANRPADHMMGRCIMAVGMSPSPADVLRA